jgi:hypothetical protein
MLAPRSTGPPDRPPASAILDLRGFCLSIKPTKVMGARAGVVEGRPVQTAPLPAEMLSLLEEMPWTAVMHAAGGTGSHDGKAMLGSGSAEVSPASSVSMTFVYDTDASTTVCGGLHGGEKGPGGGGPTERLPVVEPLRTGNEPVLPTGVVTDCLFTALGWFPPPLTQS